ncbi:hypothetical protein [Limnofasciculus baicalensis]|uniref:Uncharacterized protein n=1 Tax=Limnofasciculus baicalensis BBK-W-15 TaxID=2699891 RepID=A0AAE3GM77_9CYAN|nr:hypothetical protein [Limnofasciculus baicalensis]MCP2727181.1 hypothetical protein [Limnofasciculus baicalensis BBK-W-15]
MPFSAYKTIDAVVKEFQITYTKSNFIIETEFPIPDYFREDLEIVIQDGAADCSEYAICENMIYPVLKEIWKQYRRKFILWSHKSLTYDQNLSGFPEYILAKKSPLGNVVFDKPYFLLVEAKQDNFENGWAQCLAEMIAAQRLNDNPEQEVFGIVSNGDIWQLGKLKSNVFTRNQIFYTIQALDKLFAAINYVFQQCELLLDAEAKSQN